jgi:phenylacetate-CoA ligase
VKLRGINIFPHAIGSLIENRQDLTGEYVCRVRRDGNGRDELVVILECRGEPDEGQISGLLRQGLGVEVTTQLVGPGETAADTQIDVRQKPIRLIDERKA